MTRLTNRIRRPRRGFSLIELMTVISVIGMLAAIGFPRYREMKRRAYFAAVLSDFNTVRIASYNYFADNATYPADGAAGSPPPALLPYLPQGFEFSTSSYTLVAYCTLRLESVWRITGHAAGVAAALAAKGERAVQQVDVAELRKRLAEEKQVVDFVPGQLEKCPSPNGPPEF